MATEFSAGVVRALASAQTFAGLAGRSLVEPVDLLRGLLEEEEGHPFLHLLASGVEAVRLRESYPRLAGEGAAGLAPGGAQPALEARTHEYLVRARELARPYSPEGTVAGEFVLLALVQEDEGIRRDLEALGMCTRVLRQRVAPEQPSIPLEEPLDIARPTELADLARILDAAANRAREALRVLEDYCRFVLNDPFLSGKLKDLRHQLAETLDELPADFLLSARDTLGDVGTSLSTAREQERGSVHEVLSANAKRLQEALRSLEEYGKVLSPRLGGRLEQQRYLAYTLEKALLAGVVSRQRLGDARLYVLVSESLCQASLAGTVREALEGGAQIIQLREKQDSDRVLLAKARELRRLTRNAGALLIINDRPDLALLVEADGVHVGQDDLPVREVRRLLGPGALVGVSTHNIEQLERAILEGASYVGIGPTFPSRTKQFSEFAGLDYIRLATRHTSLPAFALGGIHLDNLPQVLAAGATRVAVSHAVCGASAPREVTARLRRLLFA